MSEVRQWPSTRESLLDRVRDLADEQAWATFVELYGPPLYRFCSRRGLQEADAADVAQSVLLTVSRAIRSFRYDPARGKFRSWLGTVAANEISRHTQRLMAAIQGYGGEPPADLAPFEGRAMAEWEVEFNAHIFRSALERIRGDFSPEIWRAFAMVWLEDRSAPEVAQSLDRSPQWVYKAKFRVLRRLREEVLFLAGDAAVFVRD